VITQVQAEVVSQGSRGRIWTGQQLMLCSCSGASASHSPCWMEAWDYWQSIQE
jgi:hypothetical protein